MLWRAIGDALANLERNGVYPNPVDTYARLVRACGESGRLSEAQAVHCHIVENGHGGDSALGNLLVQTYGKCGSVENAESVFDSLHRKTAVSWNFMIGAYASNGRGKEALQLFRRMVHEGQRADKHTFVRALCACGESDIAEGKALHAQITSAGLQLELILQNSLVSMYARCGSLDIAKIVFDGIEEKSLVSWNAMITAFAQKGHGKEAIQLYKVMVSQGVQPNEITISSVLGACSTPAHLEQGQAIHAGISKFLPVEFGVMVETSLVNMYTKCGCLGIAKDLFDRMKARSVVSWNAMLAGYAQQGHNKEAVWLYHQMDLEGMQPNSSTFSCVLGTCSSLGDLQTGESIHARAFCSGIRSEALQVALVNLYGKCGRVDDAKRVFDAVQKKSVILWTSMIATYSQHGYNREAFEIYYQMDVEANEVTYATILGACSSVEQGKTLHQRILNSNCNGGIVLETALMKMYADCEDLAAARRVFDKMVQRDSIAWNVMLGGYVQNGHASDALQLYMEMDMEPDRTTLATVLGACSLLGRLAEGKEVHKFLVEKSIDTDAVLSAALVNMYAKCGCLHTARHLFDKFHGRSTVLWNTIMAATSQHGDVRGSLSLHLQMRLEGVAPDATTFICVLLACNHAGLVEEGRACFSALVSDYCLKPSLEHYLCIADLLGRSGNVEFAQELVDTMPFQPDVVAWKTLLGSCRLQSDLKCATYAAEHITGMRPELGQAYVLLSNSYAQNERPV